MEEVIFLTFAQYTQECDQGLLEIWIRAIKERTWATARNHSYLDFSSSHPAFITGNGSIAIWEGALLKGMDWKVLLVVEC